MFCIRDIILVLKILPASNKRKFLQMIYIQLDFSQLDLPYRRTVENLFPNDGRLSKENISPLKNLFKHYYRHSFRVQVLLAANVARLSGFSINLFYSDICEDLTSLAERNRGITTDGESRAR